MQCPECGNPLVEEVGRYTDNKGKIYQCLMRNCLCEFIHESGSVYWVKTYSKKG